MILKIHDSKGDRYYEVNADGLLTDKMKWANFKTYYEQKYGENETKKLTLAVGEDNKHFSPGCYIGEVYKK